MGTDLTPDEQRLQGFLSDPDVPDDAKRQAVAHYRAIGSGGSEPAGSGDGSGSQADSPGLGAALWESLSRGRERVEGAVRDIGERITNPSDYADESLWDTTKGVAGDVATMAAPALMPGATAAGVGARTLARAAGATPETADAAGDITTGVTALGGALKGGYQGVQAWRAGRTAAALRAAQEAAAAPTAAREAGQVSQAAAAASTREALSGSSTPETAGATLREQYPGASAAGRERVQGELYDPVAQYAASKGLALEPGTPQAQALSAALEGARDKWGALQTGRERGVIESLLEKLKGGTEATDTGVLDAAGTPITRTAPPAPVTYADLDAARSREVDQGSSPPAVQGGPSCLRSFDTGRPVSCNGQGRDSLRRDHAGRLDGAEPALFQPRKIGESLEQLCSSPTRVEELLRLCRDASP